MFHYFKKKNAQEELILAQLREGERVLKHFKSASKANLTHGVIIAILKKIVCKFYKELPTI